MKLLLLIFALIFSFLSFSQIPNYVPSNGLVGWWPFTGNANDFSGFGNNGTVNGATLTTDRFGNTNQAYSFDGSSNYIDVNDAVQLRLSNTDYSISFWVNANAYSLGGGTAFVYKRSNGSQNGWGLGADQGTQNKLMMITSESMDPRAYSTSTLALNGWRFVSVTYSMLNQQIKFYINGVLDNTTTGVDFNYNPIAGMPSPSANCSSIMRFGQDTKNNSYWLNGKLDDIGIWNRALTQQEITALYTSTAGTVSALNCNGFTQTGNLFSGQVAANVSVTVPYTGGNAGFYAGQSIASTGVVGLTATRTSGTLVNGNGTVSYTVTGTPSGAGNATFAVSLGGQSCNLVLPVTTLSSQYPANSVFCANGPTAIVDVTNPTTGKTWMDRNLGASQVATSSTDQNAYGDLYQWGRRADGHQCRTSPTTATLSSVDQPAHGSFILAPNAPYDWRSPQNTNLWQGVNGVNNPCPNGYKVPSQTELDNERLSWSSNNGIGAFASTLKWPLAGYRQGNDGVIINIGSSSHSVSSNISATNYLNLLISTVSYIGNSWRSHGCSIRCIKETTGSVGAINCNGTTQSGALYNNQPASNVTASVPYTVGNGGYYPAQSITSTGVTGLTATISQGLFANGAGNLSFTISGTPSAVGTATFALNIGGQACSFILNVQSFATLSINTNDTICNGINTTLTASVANAGTSCAAPGLSGTLTNGLVGFWPFCGNANDLSGNANNGTVNGATLTTDRFGVANQAYSFDGVNDYVMVGNSNNLNSISSVSVSGWLNAAQLGGVRGLVSKWNQNGNPCYNFSTSVDGMNNNFVGATSQYPSTVLVSSNSLSVSNWFYFTFTHDQNVGGKIYLNGALVGTNNTTGSICQSATDLYFGAQWNVSSLWRFFNGKLDDIAIYNRAITQQEITQLYQQGQPTYSWSPGGATTPSITVSPTQTTTYTCTVTMNGATTTQSQTITVNPLPTVNAGQDQTVFAGTQVTLSGSGANSYSWNNGISNNTPFTANTTTTYTVTGTSNGCSSTDQVLVTVLTAPTLSINTNDTICNGISTTLTASVANAGTSCAAPGLSGTLTNGLVGYWPFCGNANDLSGNAN
ncbi:MAG: LamG domain-containing protein, partial [Crocinitomicaceae bacterium]|nr:LamG domain-containing protein [Crocinitomicaceae bacterium]